MPKSIDAQLSIQLIEKGDLSRLSQRFGVQLDFASFVNVLEHSHVISRQQTHVTS